MYACENAGTVYGRKDVGGIAGQTEPYIAIDLSEDIVYQLTENIDKMHDLTGVMLDDAGTESDTLSARLTVVQDFVDKALEDTSFLADRTVGWTDEMIGSVNDAGTARVRLRRRKITILIIRVRRRSIRTPMGSMKIT